MPAGLRACLGRRMGLLRPKNTNPRFLLYAYLGPEFQAEIGRRSIHGATVDRIPLNDLGEWPLSLPDRPTQDAIADLLGALDEKIELNRLMNETLEGIARAIFKSWFVDFDPVRAKMEGRASGLPAEIADLFPDRFEDSKIGEIPNGWRPAVLGDIAVNIRDQVKPEGSEAKPYVGLEHVPRRSIALTDWGMSDKLMSDKFAFEKGDVLFGKLRPYFHKVVEAPIRGLCSTDILVIRARAPQWSAFTLMWLSSDDVVANADATSTGTRMPRTNWRDVASFPVTLPPRELAQTFQALAGPLIERIQTMIGESRALACVRDVLLPRLISGEIHVGTAHEAAGA